MHIIPAIDIYNGECVRLYQGDYEAIERYQRDPVVVARQFEAAGAKRIHIIDLNAARGHRDGNRKIIRKIRRAVPAVQLQIGGGVRNDYVVEELIDIGVDRLVVGTIFAKTPHVLEGWIAHYGEMFIAGIDARDGKVCVEGWERKTKIDALDLALRANQLGIEEIIYTNIAHDGTLRGPDIHGTIEIAQAINTPMILSGGISNVKDIASIIEQSKGKIAGIILGKSLYENAIDLSEIIAQYSNVAG